VYGEDYDRGMSVSGRQRRERRSFGASAPPLFALPRADRKPRHTRQCFTMWMRTMRRARTRGGAQSAILDCLVLDSNSDWDGDGLDYNTSLTTCRHLRATAVAEFVQRQASRLTVNWRSLET